MGKSLAEKKKKEEKKTFFPDPCYVYCVRLTDTCPLHLHVVALLLVLIASIVLICKSLWIKASAK